MSETANHITAPNQETKPARLEAEKALPYDIVDMTDTGPKEALRYLKELAAATNGKGEPSYVFHGAHMTGFHERDGLPEVGWNETLDPSVSRQTEHPAVYATKAVEGALVHAVLKHRPEDAGDNHGQTFALSMNGGGKKVLMSPQLQEAANEGQLTFTDGFLYVLPASEFTESWQGGNHEVTANHAVTPLLGIKIGESLGSELMKYLEIGSFVEDERREKMKLDKLWSQYYTPIGSPAYEKANSERVKDGTIKVYKIGDATLVANIKLDDAGNVVSGHDYNPEATSMSDTEAAWDRYLEETPPEQRVVLFEGDEQVFGTRKEAIEQRTDSGLVQYLAHKDGVVGLRGEPTPEEESKALFEKGVSREEVLALIVARGLEGVLAEDDKNPNNLAGHIYQVAAELGFEGFEVYSEEQKQAINREGRVEEVLKAISDKAASLVPTLNDILKSSLRGEDIFIVNEGTVKINPELGKNPQEAIFDKLNWDGNSRMSEIAKLDMEVRDRHIFERIISALDAGLKPFVPYGGSHIVTIEPALRAYLRQQ